MKHIQDGQYVSLNAQVDHFSLTLITMTRQMDIRHSYVISRYGVFATALALSIAPQVLAPAPAAAGTSDTIRVSAESSRPPLPTVVSDVFPDGTNGWPADTGSLRQPGAFVLGPNGADNVVAFTYSTFTSGPRTIEVEPGESAEIWLTPTLTGPNHLNVFSIDDEGRRSDTYTYLFYVNP
ncbi:hypothetical protein ACFV0Z_24065 [Streptomyces xiamenensis]|uniref:hypothetical protein n=1 Tax=Streptomyces xiamenensis TaxID=408015 RepID=UPI00367D3E9C